MNGKPVSKNIKLRYNSPILYSEGAIHIKSRLQQAEPNARSTKLSRSHSKKNYFTFLVVQEIHVRYWHCSFSTMLNELRHVYMIPMLRSMLRSFRSHCAVINFKGANTELKVAINQNLKQLLRDMYCKIKYNFIHPALHIWKEHRNVWWD